MAAPTLADFRATFPEFQNLEDAHITQHLTLVSGITDEDWWGEYYTLAVLYGTADSLAQSPWGYNARLAAPGAETAYKTRLNELRIRLPKRGLVVYGRGSSTVGNV